MENTLENKARFFAQYWGQSVMYYYSENNKKSYQEDIYGYIRISGLKNCHLQLRLLSSITDEDASEYLLSIGCYVNDLRISQAKMQLEEDYDADLYGTDFLRSKGYALPYMGIEVKQLVEFGWVKLQS